MRSRSGRIERLTADSLASVRQQYFPSSVAVDVDIDGRYGGCVHTDSLPPRWQDGIRETPSRA